MNTLLERFGVFDIFSMLIPGICLLSLTKCFIPPTVLSFINITINFDTVTFLIISYIFGIVFHELGTICDNVFLHKWLFKGAPRKLLFDEHKVLFKGKPIEYQLAIKTKETLMREYGVTNMSKMNQEDLSDFVSCTCINTLEVEGLNGKPDKMLTISEMSRSLFLGCFILCILQLFEYNRTEFIINVIVLFVLASIFFIRKRRYEIYRMRTLMRFFRIYKNKLNKDDDKQTTKNSKF